MESRSEFRRIFPSAEGNRLKQGRLPCPKRHTEKEKVEYPGALHLEKDEAIMQGRSEKDRIKRDDGKNEAEGAC